MSSSRKRSTVDRMIRKKAAETTARATDPFHNGQTPACRSLVEAARDVFPELQQELPEREKKPASGLGGMLRWRLLRARKARAPPPPPPLADSPRGGSTNTNNNTANNPSGQEAATTTTTTTAKKKRKRKKKKKEAGGGASAEATADATTTTTAQAAPNHHRGPLGPFPDERVSADPEKDDDLPAPTLDALDRSARSLARSDGQPPSLDELDRSLREHELEERLIQDSSVPPSLHALPSDDHLHDNHTNHHQNNHHHHHNNNTDMADGHSSAVFFQQIQPQASQVFTNEDTAFLQDDYNDDEEIMLPLSPPAGEPRKSPTTGVEGRPNGADSPSGGRSPLDPPETPRMRGRTLSSSSFASFDGSLAPNKAEPFDGDLTPNNPPPEAPPPEAVASPNHEWVPEEGSPGKKETPPGEVIKDPLKLPYLLRLSFASGATTRALDGSLISTERSRFHDPNSPGSTLDTTKILWEEWMGQLLGQTELDEAILRRVDKDLDAFVGFLQSKLWGGDQPLGISFASLQEAVTGIECYSCQMDARKQLERWDQRSDRKKLVLDPAVLMDYGPPPPDAEVDAAFDYVALEEGHHTPSSPKDPAEDDPESEDEGVDLGRHVSFVLAAESSKAKAGGGGGKPVHNKQFYLEGFTIKHLDTLLEEWIPCGVEEDTMVSASLGSSAPSAGSALLEGSESARVEFEDILRIQRKVLEKENILKISLDRLQEMGKGLLDEMGQGGWSSSSSTPQLNLEFMAFPKVKSVDSNCTEYTQQILLILRLMIQAKSSSLADAQLDIWTNFLEALNRALQACETFYSQIEALADQRGVIPKVFVSADLRCHFQTLVREKIGLWTDFSNTLCGHLTSRTLKEMYTYGTWNDEYGSTASQQKAPQAKPAAGKKTPDKDGMDLDECCLKVVQELAEWTETILGSRMSEIYRERMAHTERLLELLQAVVEPITKEYATVEKYFSAEKNVYFASLCSNIVLAQGVKKRMRLIDNSEVEGMATGAILMWTHVRIMQHRVITSQLSPPLPLQLKRWILQEDSSCFEDWRGSGASSAVNSYHQKYCQPGRCGKRRTMCVLVGMLYQWLEDQCKVWMAEKAEKELLTDFGQASTASNLADTPTVAQNSGGNAGKSSKSKRNRKKKNKNIAQVQSRNTSSKSDAVEEKRTNIDSNTDTPTTLIVNVGNPVQETFESVLVEQEPPVEASTLSELRKETGQDQQKLTTDLSASKDTVSIPPGHAPSPTKEDPMGGEPIKGNQAQQSTEPNLDNSEASSCADEDISTPQVYILDGTKQLCAQSFLVARIHELFDKSQSIDSFFTIG